MNENNININEEIKSPIYSSEFMMTRDLFYDFYSVSYNSMKKLFLFCLCFATLEMVISIVCRNYNVAAWGIVLSVIMLLVYLRTRRMERIGYERSVLSAGDKHMVTGKLYEDKFGAGNDGFEKKFFYDQITKFFETGNFLLLHLQHGLYVILSKKDLNANIDEVKSFLIQKCPLVKKKTFVNCSNDKKQSSIFLIIMFIVSVIGTVVGAILKFNT